MILSKTKSYKFEQTKEYTKKKQELAKRLKICFSYLNC